MRFFVDGYNVTMADDATRRLSREDQRLALVRRVAARRADLLGRRGEVTVVFDGFGDGSGDEQASGVRVVFAGSESADDVIVRMARTSGEPVTLVTSDRELQARVQSVCDCEVRVLGASSLFDEPLVRRPRRRRFGGSTAGLPKGANRITEELKRIWLDQSEKE